MLMLVGGHLQAISSCGGKACDEAMTLILDHSKTLSVVCYSVVVNPIPIMCSHTSSCVPTVVFYWNFTCNVIKELMSVAYHITCNIPAEHNCWYTTLYSENSQKYLSQSVSTLGHMNSIFQMRMSGDSRAACP